MRKLIARLAVLFTLGGLALMASPASPAHAALGLYRVTGISAYDATSPKSATASCNVGDDLLTVGGRINDGAGNVLLSQAYANAALTTGYAWGIEAIATANPWSVEIMIVCAPAGAVSNLQLEDTTVGPNVNAKYARADCDPGQITFGAGYRLNNAWGAVAIDEVRFGTNLDYVAVTSYNYVAPASYSLTSQAICGDPPPAYELREFESANNAISPKTETTNSCDAGSDISGVGAYITGGLGNVSIATLNPRPQLSAAEVTAREIGNYAVDWKVMAQAVCVG